MRKIRRTLGLLLALVMIIMSASTAFTSLATDNDASDAGSSSYVSSDASSGSDSSSGGGADNSGSSSEASSSVNDTGDNTSSGTNDNAASAGAPETGDSGDFGDSSGSNDNAASDDSDNAGGDASDGDSSENAGDGGNDASDKNTSGDNGDNSGDENNDKDNSLTENQTSGDDNESGEDAQQNNPAEGEDGEGENDPSSGEEANPNGEDNNDNNIIEDNNNEENDSGNKVLTSDNDLPVISDNDKKSSEETTTLKGFFRSVLAELFRWIFPGPHQQKVELSDDTTCVTLSGVLPSGVEAQAIVLGDEELALYGDDVLCAYDIALFADGEEFEPEDVIRIDIESEAIADALERGALLEVWRISEKGTRLKVRDAAAEDGMISFESDNLSLYIITLSSLDCTITTSDGETYEIEVTYTADSGIPMEGTMLWVQEYIPADIDYDMYVSESITASGFDAENVLFTKVFDIKIVDEKDESIVYEPSGEVNVSIRLLDVELGEDEKVGVYHFVRDEEENNDIDDTRSAADADSAAAFATGEDVITDIGSDSQADDDSGIKGDVKDSKSDDGAKGGAKDSKSDDGAKGDVKDSTFDDGSKGGAKDSKSDDGAKGDVKDSTFDDGSIAITDDKTGSGDEVVSNAVLETSEGPASFTVYSMEPSVEDEIVSFTTDSFSVYVLVAAKDPPTNQNIEIVHDPAELQQNYSDTHGFFFSRSNGNYCTNTFNNTGKCFAETSDIMNASRWYFEAVDVSANKYLIYTYLSGTKNYLYNVSSNDAGLTTNSANANVFEISQAATNLFYIKIENQNKWFQYSGSGKGMRFYPDNSNNANCQITITYASSISVPDEYYELDGKTFGIAYHEESVKAAGLMALDKPVGTQNRLVASELLVRPDVLDNTGDLLVAQDSDLTDWTFHTQGENYYYVTAQVGGETKYLTLDGKNLVLASAPHPINSLIQVDGGTGAYQGKYRLSVGGYAVTLMAGNIVNGFVSSTDGAAYSWLTLVTKSQLLHDEDFTIYSAEKVDISDVTKVPDQTEVVIYTRVWNEQKLKYEFYAISSDGSLIRCYESGDMIQWVGSTVNTAKWAFTEYHYGDGTPNYYYELQNTYSGQYLAPQVASGQILSPNTLGIHLNGRRYGYYYSSILAWDKGYYSYAGIKPLNGSIVSCDMEDAAPFYFAIMKPTVLVDEPTTVSTIDHTQYGITMKVKNFDDRLDESNFLGDNSGGLGTKLVQGLLSTDLGADGYPTTQFPKAKPAPGTSLGTLFAGATEVNHLFIENTYYSSGYYEFDSTQNFATLRDENGNLTSNFTVYNELATARGTLDRESLKHGQFLPFNGLSDEYSTLNPENLYDALVVELPDSDPRKGEKLRLVEGETDYYFGVEIEASFTQTPNGLDAWGHDIIYEFTGDDDFWLYVDGELLIDLGGIHSAVAGSVNYRTGDVYVNGKYFTIRQLFRQNYLKRNPTASESEIAAFLSQYFDDGSTIFKEYTTHTMKIFYMERGAGASNLHMRFNLASVKPGNVLLTKQIAGIDNVESCIADYPYQIYYKLSDSDVENLLVPDNPNGIKVVYKDTNRSVKYHERFTGRDGTTYQHVYILRPGETAEISFPNEAIDYSIKECCVDPEVYTSVEVNGLTINGTPASASSSRKDFKIDYDKVLTRTRVTFVNNVDPTSLSTLRFKKLLFEENGTTPIHRDANDTTFSFRLYLGTENEDSDDLPPANMYKYHVLDEDGHYCAWNEAAGKFVSLGATNFESLTPSAKKAATFVTSQNGSIGDIPVDYSVEIRQVLPGTQYKYLERADEIPDGYTLQKYVVDGVETANQAPPTDAIAPRTTYNISVNNLKGWGLRVNKVWTDKDYMEQRDPAYFAVFTQSGGATTLKDGTVRRLTTDNDSVYWFFYTLGGVSFDNYVVREVKLTNPTVDDSTDVVTHYDSMSIVDPGDTNSFAGKQYGDASSSTFTYKVSYQKGAILPGANVRVDKMTNKRAGIDIYKTDWDGSPLAGAVFTLTDGSGNNAGAATYTSDDDGFVTTAYLRENETYTLTEIESPTGYLAMPTPVTISRSGTTVTVTGDSDNSGYHLLDDTDSADRMALIAIKNKPASFIIKKTAYTKDGDPLPGVHFALYAQVMGSGGQPQKDFRPITGFEDLVTTAAGTLPEITEAFSNGTLSAGTYYLYERDTPDGYRPLESDVKFTISDTGVVSIDSAPSGVELETVNGATPSYTIVIPNRSFGTASITVSKVVANGTTADTNGTAQFNFTAKLYRPDGITAWEYNGGGFTNGVLSFALNHNTSKELVVPLNAVLIVTEDAAVPYDTSYQVNGGSAVEDSVCPVSVTADGTIVFTNTRKTIEVPVQKKAVNKGGTFTFTAEIIDGTTPVSGYAIYTDASNSANNIVTDADGKATFTLSPGKGKTVTRNLVIPYGTKFTITETAELFYKTTLKTTIGSSSTTSETRTREFTADQTVEKITLLFTNTYAPISPTGVNIDHKPYMALFICGAAILTICLVPAVLRRRKHRQRR
ncbi:MAG: hypothetical protein IKD89_00265 [Clostridia bacterium]|nr:hypothetical protein [Clostridia bacterium]